MSAPSRVPLARRLTREVKVGALGIGAHNPLRVQSMTTTDTRDVRATAAQAARLAEAGCELVRITAPGLLEARALGEIRAELARRGLRVPLCADIHFTPNAALEAAKHVEKVRINPGNYADRKKFAVREYSDAEYAAELERVAARVRPLLVRCRELGRALRIGANHGSLSDRILNRFGDTPLGMVESALEFLDVCESENFRDVVFSMKSSNPRVAIHAYRLLAARLEARAPGAPSYPFHLGVTEAGDGEDARIKSAIGIGALLEDGIGDTLRVSLTEDPVREIPVARALAARYDARAAAQKKERAHVAASNGAALSGEALRERGAASSGVAARAEERVVVTARAQDAEARARQDRAAAVSRGALSSAAEEDAATRAARVNAAEGGDRFHYARRKTRALGNMGGEQPVRVEALLGAVPADAQRAVREIARELAALGELDCEGLLVVVRDESEVPRLADFARALKALPDAPPLAAFSTAQLAPACAPHVARVAFEITDASAVPAQLAAPAEWVLGADAHAFARALEHAAPVLASVACAPLSALAMEEAPAPPARDAAATSPTHAVRYLLALLHAQGHTEVPIALRHLYTTRDTEARAAETSAQTADARAEIAPTPEAHAEATPAVAVPAQPDAHATGTRAQPDAHAPTSDAALLCAATDLGAALCDGVGDLVSLGGAGGLARDVRLAYRILQGARLRSSWTEFISCPSCGRTLFDLEETTARVKAATAHLAGLKIAVMGCIVNGPGEMADADFGYVGSGVGRVDLYVGRERVLRNVDAKNAPARLVDLIRSHGRWVDPPARPAEGLPQR